MLYWKSFFDQAETDLQRAKNLFSSDDFGFSAYCAQQALEKYIKSYFYKLDLIENNNTYRFGHMPLSAILSDIKRETRRIEHQQRNNRLFSNMLKPLISLYKPLMDIFHEMKEPEQKILWWKYSLNLPSATQIFDEKLKVMSKSLSKFNNTLNLYNEQQLDPNLNKIQQTFPKDFERILTLRDDMKDMAEAAIELNLDKMKQKQGGIENISNLLESFDELQNSDEPIGKFIQGDMKRLMAYTRGVILHCGTIMKSFPHEDIGRYPTEIDGKESTLLYAENHEGLLLLINEISDVCDKIKTQIDISQ